MHPSEVWGRLYFQVLFNEKIKNKNQQEFVSIKQLCANPELNIHVLRRVLGVSSLVCPPWLVQALNKDFNYKLLLKSERIV